MFVIQKKSSKWRLLHDLHQINAAMENMGALQNGLPSPTMIAMNWHLTIIDLKDCLFTIPLDPADALCFVFSVPSTDDFEPCARYHWMVLPQGMKNNPMICQWSVARPLSPTREQDPWALIYHYIIYSRGHKDRV